MTKLTVKVGQKETTEKKEIHSRSVLRSVLQPRNWRKIEVYIYTIY